MPIEHLITLITKHITLIFHRIQSYLKYVKYIIGAKLIVCFSPPSPWDTLGVTLLVKPSPMSIWSHGWQPSGCFGSRNADTHYIVGNNQHSGGGESVLGGSKGDFSNWEGGSHRADNSHGNFWQALVANYSTVGNTGCSLVAHSKVCPAATGEDRDSLSEISAPRDKGNSSFAAEN